MANICNNELEITGSKDQLENLYKRLIDQDKTLTDLIPNFTIYDSSDYCILNNNDINYDGYRLDISFGSKYDCPIDEISELSEEYPELSFEVRFEEGGNGYFGTSNIYNGCCDTTEMSELEFIEAFNSDYINQRDTLLELPYEEFIILYAQNCTFEEHPFGYLDRHVVKRIKKRDLPKFINRKWFDKKAHEEYKQRLSGCPTIEPKTKE